MKVLPVLLILLAIIISVIPQYTDCDSQGRYLTLEDGRQIPMKCHWTARAELAVGIPLLFTGVGLFYARHKETRIMLSILGGALGIFAILLPTALVGVCVSAEMLCNSIMKPALILTGSLAILISLALLVFSATRKENAAPA